MAAGLGFKTFTTGEVLTAADVNGYLMQGILVFANAAARTSAITSPQEGQYSFLKDTNALEYYDGAAWVGAPVGDITAVTAGTGISGGGTSGAVTITNSMATEITAAGDIVVGTGNATFDNLPIGSTGQVLTADTTVSPYKVKWATPAAGGKILQVVQGTLGTAVSTTSASYVTTNLTASITPSSTSSKVLIFVSLNCAGNNSGDGGKTTIYRGDVSTGTNLAGASDFFQYFFVNTSIYYLSQNMSYLDSPNTTSATTYTVAFKRMAGTVETLQGLRTIVLMEVGA